MVKKKSIIQEYFSPYRLRMWELMWEFQKISFVFENIHTEVNWFVKNKFLIKKREKGETTYKPNLRNHTVKSVIKCFSQCIYVETNKHLKARKNTQAKS